jgi:hypothetical protein
MLNLRILSLLLCLDSRLLPNTTTNSRLIAIKDKRHVLETVSLGLRVEEEGNKAVNDEDSDKDKVVLPRNGRERNGVDKGVEDERGDCGEPSDAETARAQRKGPDFAGVGG